MSPIPSVLELPPDKRLAQVNPEIHSKGHVYAASDVVRRQVLVLSQRMSGIQMAIEECVGEGCSIASLFESADLKLRKGRTGSFVVRRLSPEELPGYLDETRKHYDRVVIGAVNASKWKMAAIAV